MLTKADDDQKWRAGWEAMCLRRPELFRIAAEALLPKFQGMDVTAIQIALEEIWEGYQGCLAETDDFEDAPTAKLNLENLARKANELAELMLNLDQGATEVMNYTNVPQKLFQDAKPFNLPGSDRWGLVFEGLTKQDFLRRQLEHSAGDLWVIRLHALAKLAEMKANWIGALIAKGGKIDLATRLHGSPVDSLAKTCFEFAKAHGCRTQAVVLKMVQIILETSQVGKIDKSAGRKAVRKVAQTQPKGGGD